MRSSLIPDFLTAFGMTALSAWTVSWVLWMLGRQYWRQGMAQAVLSTALFGLAYVFFALQSKLGVVELQVLSKTLISAAMAAFTVALQRFRQSTDWRRDSVVVVVPLLGSLLLALWYVPQDMTSFNRLQTIITVVQTLYTLHVLFAMRKSTPGMGWVLVTGAACVQLVSIVPLVFAKHRPSPAFMQDLPLGSVLAMWAVCLMLFLKLVVTSVGFLVMLRDRQAALDQHRAQLDPLTQLPTRNALTQGMQQVLAQSADAAKPLSVMVVDIDHFKRVNDSHGHLAGDKAIQLVAHILQEQSRSQDLVARYGGEEFVLLLPDTEIHVAERVAQRLCDKVRSTPLMLPNGTALQVTISVGVHAELPSTETGWERLMNAADEAMYRAKRTGRDRVVLTRRTATA